MNNKKTFHEVSEIWCDAKRPIVKHSTLCAYQLTLQTHLLPRFGAAENITEKDVQQFVIDKCTSGLARKTVRDIVAVLKSVIKYGNKHGIFHFEEWEIEYPTQTENKLPPTLYGQTNEKYKEDSRKSNTADRKPITYSRASNFGSKNEM